MTPVKHRQYSTASPAQGHTKASKQHWTSAAEPENCSALELSSNPLAAPSMLICYVISCIATGPYLHTQAIQKLKTGAAGVLLWDPVERHPCLTPALGQPCGSEGNVCHSFTALGICNQHFAPQHNNFFGGRAATNNFNLSCTSIGSGKTFCRLQRPCTCQG